MRPLIIYIFAMLSAFPACAAEKQKAVASLDPKWIIQQLNEHAEHGAVLALCGRGLLSCDEARKHLQFLTAQCTHTFLATLDLDAHLEISQNYYDAADPSFIPFLRRRGGAILEPVKLMAYPTPDTVAIAMCPSESKVFGNALRQLRMLKTD